jgi:hypothetical protein
MIIAEERNLTYEEIIKSCADDSVSKKACWKYQVTFEEDVLPFTFPMFFKS